MREWRCSWDFANKVQERANTLKNQDDRARALELSLECLPQRPTTAMVHYMLLTIAGIWDSRRVRWQRAKMLFRQEPRPERLATFLLVKLKGFRNVAGQIAKALHDPKAIEAAIRAGKRFGIALVSLGTTAIEMASKVSGMMGSLLKGVLGRKDQGDPKPVERYVRIREMRERIRSWGSDRLAPTAESSRSG